MSHTSTIVHDGKTWTIHHDGEFSGNAAFVLDRDEVQDLNDHECMIRIPTEVLKELIGRHAQALRTREIDRVSGAEYLNITARTLT